MRITLTCTVILSCGLGLFAVAEAPPDAASARALSEAPLRFQTAVFTGETFPTLEGVGAVEKRLGPVTVRTTFHDADRAVVPTPRRPGPYFAVVELVPKEGRPLRRLFTLYRTADALAPDFRFDPKDPAPLARAAGLDTERVTRQATLVAATWKDRPFRDCAADPRVARLLAGLALDKGTGPVTRNNDAFVWERQAWVTLARDLQGTARTFSKPFVAPRPLQGKPAPVVRAGTPAEAGVKPDTAARLDALLTTWANDDDQAFAVCIVRHGVIVLHKAYGTRDGRPMTVETPSWMASVTKTLSASLMMMLVDQGLVDLDDPVDRYLPALRGIPVDRPLTIRHLYTHTNGLDKFPGLDDGLPDVADRVADYYAHVQVGKAWAYNGMGYTLGGKVLESVTGEAVPLAFRRHLLDPLGCEHTEVVGTHADAFSTPLDMARFGQMLLNRGSSGDQLFFRPETFRRMLPQKLNAVLGPDATKTFGIGLDGSPERFGHGAASAATFQVDVAADLVVIMTRNQMGKNQDRYNGKFQEALRECLLSP